MQSREGWGIRRTLGAVLAATTGDKDWCLMRRVGVLVLQADDGRNLKVV